MLEGKGELDGARNWGTGSEGAEGPGSEQA